VISPSRGSTETVNWCVRLMRSDGSTNNWTLRSIGGIDSAPRRSVNMRSWLTQTPLSFVVRHKNDPAVPVGPPVPEATISATINDFRSSAWNDTLLVWRFLQQPYDSPPQPTSSDPAWIVARTFRSGPSYFTLSIT
jgi:hypothetical protein